MLRNLVRAPRPTTFDDGLLDRWFEEALRLPGSLPLDVREEDEAYAVRCEVPGFEPSEVHVELTNDVLTIRAERTSEGERTRRTQSVRFERPLDRDAVQAELKNGVLTVTLRKSAAARPRRIEVRAASTPPAQQLEQRAEPPAS
jgi:HSP20 family molecular chaperone IbpA